MLGFGIVCREICFFCGDYQGFEGETVNYSVPCAAARSIFHCLVVFCHVFGCFSRSTCFCLHMVSSLIAFSIVLFVFLLWSILSTFQSWLNMSFRSQRVVLFVSSGFCWKVGGGGGCDFRRFILFWVALSRKTPDSKNLFRFRLQ